MKVAVTVIISGKDITIDLTGSADEVETGFNVPFDGSLKVACYYAVRTLLLDQENSEDFIPQNEGMFRPVKVIAPEGSIFNPKFPRACFARMAQVQRVIDCIIRALSPVMPEKVTAGNAATVMSVSFSGFNKTINQYWVCVEVNEGSYGARASKDGLDSVDNLMANTRNVPIEEIELRYPLRVERYELRDEPPGAGQYRGGCGHVRAVKFLEDGFFSCNGDRIKEPPFGIFGGKNGYGARLTMNPETKNMEELPSKVSGRKVVNGTVMKVLGPASAGYGDPFLRNPEKVLDDVLDDIINEDIAVNDYGVVIVSGEIDYVATKNLRER